MSSSSSVTAHEETSSLPATKTPATRVPETAHLSRSSSNATAAAIAQADQAINNKAKHDVAVNANEEEELPRSNSNKPNFNKGRAFWMIMLSLAMSLFLSALDLTALSTALPRIATDLESENFTWIGSAYALASTAFCEQPSYFLDIWLTILIHKID